MILIACTRPLLAVKTGVNPDTGKVQYKINPYSRIPANPAKGEINIPCGQCMECRLQYARNWADRCMLEAMEHEHNYFLTLTYDEEHVPRTYNDEDNEVLSLLKRDLQLFWKRLRINLERSEKDKIRYFACGEYGDHTFRPHYHAIVFGLEIDDLVFAKYSPKSHEPIFTSKILDEIWGNGNVFIGECTWKSCAYVARYVTKKQKGFTSAAYDALGIEPDFVIMSRKPGIGSQYYDKHKSMFDYDCINIPTPDGGLKVKPPRYFQKLLESDDPEKLKWYKERKKLAGEIAQSAKLQGTDLDQFDYYSVEEQAAADRTKIFKRDGV